MSKLWVIKYEKESIDVVEDAHVYLILMMKGLVEGKPVDSRTYTVLNGKSLTKESLFPLMATGNWFDGRVILDNVSPAGVDHVLRLRGSVVVNMPQA
ncbi:hypothetical protein KJ951_04405 [Patescibacteria group bacterium]|nr:hypothetical protein [Patescibacteria group bacterium]MBU1703620.1 hypothetical protein [Patescibacteria group bacterium]MBU1953929.1 hypothetical protein [Patescibacteria group bacterium]